jgi:hypothetical protein
MFGEDGWCHSCGVPLREQVGSLVMQRRGLTVAGVWMPNWKSDAPCMTLEIANEVRSLFRVDLREVKWAKSSPGDAMQLVIPSTTEAWFDEGLMEKQVVKYDRRQEDRCDVCMTWKWPPLLFGNLPPIQNVAQLFEYDVVASPEWFGSGRSAYRQVLFRRELAELLVAASPRDFAIKEVMELTGVFGSEPYWTELIKPAPVPAGAVSEIFVAELLPESTVKGSPTASARAAAGKARKLLVDSGRLVSADALTSIAHKLFDGGEVEEAMSLWRQAAEHGSSAARDAIDSHREPGSQH